MFQQIITIKSQQKLSSQILILQLRYLRLRSDSVKHLTKEANERKRDILLSCIKW